MSFRPIQNQILKILVIDPTPAPLLNKAALPVGNALHNGRPTGFRVFVQRAPRTLAMGELLEVQVVRIDREGRWCFADYLEPEK